MCFVFQRCEFNMDNLSKPELLTLLSIMEGELEARDLVIEALRVSLVLHHYDTTGYIPHSLTSNNIPCPIPYRQISGIDPEIIHVFHFF